MIGMLDQVPETLSSAMLKQKEAGVQNTPASIRIEPLLTSVKFDDLLLLEELRKVFSLRK